MIITYIFTRMVHIHKCTSYSLIFTHIHSYNCTFLLSLPSLHLIAHPDSHDNHPMSSYQTRPNPPTPMARSSVYSSGTSSVWPTSSIVWKAPVAGDGIGPAMKKQVRKMPNLNLKCQHAQFNGDRILKTIKDKRGSNKLQIAQKHNINAIDSTQ